MTAATLQLDLRDSHARTRRTMTLSLAIHALLFLWIMTFKAPEDTSPPLTEILVLDPGDLAAAAAAAAPSAPAARTDPNPGIALKTVRDNASFQRSTTNDIALERESEEVADRMAARLAALTQGERPTTAGTASVPSALFGSGPATVSGTGTGNSPVALSRGGALGGGAALPLHRGGSGSGSAASVPATIPAAKPAATAPAQVGDATARRTIAGASVAGPIADRPVLHTVVPEYPEWAKREGVEGSVTLYFVVRSDGTVKENVVIQKTAGFGDFDENARAAIRAWRFEPLRHGRTGEQWGTITFHFRLR